MQYQGFEQNKIVVMDKKAINSCDFVVCHLLPRALTLLQKKRPTVYEIPRIILKYSTQKYYYLPDDLFFPQFFIESRSSIEDDRVEKKYQYFEHKIEETLEQRYGNNQYIKEYKKYQNYECQKEDLIFNFYSGYYIHSHDIVHNQFSDFMNLELDKQIFNQKKINKLFFNSRFECGNLYQAYLVNSNYQVSENQYDLIIQNDINTKGYNQWFYFSISGLLPLKIKLNIVNFTNQFSLFAKGMKPAVLSIKNLMKYNKGWMRGGSQVYYHKSKLSGIEPTNYFCLSFSYISNEKYDTVFFAMNYPYPYSKLAYLFNSLQLCKLSDNLQFNLIGKHLPQIKSLPNPFQKLLPFNYDYQQL